MRRFPPAWILLLLLGACSTASWDKPGATPELVQKDGQECWDKAYNVARSSATGTTEGMVVGAPADRRRDRAMDEQGAFQQCMRDKGYSEKK